MTDTQRSRDTRQITRAGGDTVIAFAHARFVGVNEDGAYEYEWPVAIHRVRWTHRLAGRLVAFYLLARAFAR